MAVVSKYEAYVHQRTTYFGETRYCVGHYDEHSNQYYWPISAKTQRASGCSVAFSRTLAGFGGDYQYTTRRSALAAARRIYGGEQE